MGISILLHSDFVYRKIKHNLKFGAFFLGKKSKVINFYLLVY
jgi:hypothetical protein